MIGQHLDYLIDEFEKEYFNEMTRRERVITSLSVPVAAITVIGSSLLFIFRETMEIFTTEFDEKTVALLVEASIISGLVFLALWYYLVQIFIGEFYRGVPYANERRKLFKEYIDYYRYFAPQHIKQKALDNYKSDRLSYLVECVDHNQRVNDRKYLYRYKFLKLLVVNLACVAGTFVLLYLSQARVFFDGQ